MLINPKLLIADEPTASLDEDNSINTAELIAGLKKQGRIVIVATHESYFDRLADEIIYLEYGEIERVITENAGADIRETPDMGTDESTKKLSAVKYCLKRDRKLLKPLSLLPFVIMFMLIMLVSTVQNCFDDEYMKQIVEQYPTDSFSIFENQTENFPYKDELKLYDYYVFEENNVTALYLADRKDSVFTIDGMLMCGDFPDRENEIIITCELADSILTKSSDMQKLIGQKYIFMDREFVISGILYSMDDEKLQEGRNENFSLYYNNDVYYRRNEGNIIYIPYDTIQGMGSKSIKDYGGLAILNASYPDLFMKDEVVNAVRQMNGGNYVNAYYSKVEDSQSTLDGMAVIFIAVFIVCFVISCIFMSSQIQIELFYRRKELGFLQLFGLPKKRVRQLVFTGYVIKLAIAFGMAAVAYLLCIAGYYIATGHFVIMNLLHILIVLAAVGLFYCLTVKLTSDKFLKKAVAELII